MDEFNINNMKPDIIVEGDVMLKEYQFIVEEREGKLLKIGRVNMKDSFICLLAPFVGCP